MAIRRIKGESDREFIARAVGRPGLPDDQRSYWKNREKRMAYSKRRYHLKKPEYAAAGRAWKIKNPGKVFELNLRKYGVTTEQYYEILRRQGGVCAICFGPQDRKQSGKIDAMCVDHDHVTGVIRGLLCCTCNLTLGRFKESPERFMRASMYLIIHAKKP